MEKKKALNEGKSREFNEEMAKKAQPVEYFVHEGMLARQERTIKRLWVLCIILIALLFGSWVGFFVYEGQFEDVSVEQDIDTGEGDAVLAGYGDVYYGESATKG